MYTNHQRHKFAKWKKSNQKYLQSFNVRVSPPCTFSVIICLSVACVASSVVGNESEQKQARSFAAHLRVNKQNHDLQRLLFSVS